MELTAEKESQIIEAYKRGTKTIVIQSEHGLSPGTLYRFLHRKGLTLRTAPVTEKAAPSTESPEISTVQALPITLLPPVAARLRCKDCGREYDPSLTKHGLADRRDKLCWVCSGWAADCRGIREVYNKDGSKVTPEAQAEVSRLIRLKPADLTILAVEGDKTTEHFRRYIKVSRETANFVRQLRVDRDCSWRSVARYYSLVWDAPWGGNQLAGMVICMKSAELLGENYMESPWN